MGSVDINTFELIGRIGLIVIKALIDIVAAVG